MGLAIYKKIIEDHGGEIYLLNSNTYGGACVSLNYIKFDCMDNFNEILIIDDEIDICKQFVRFIK